MTEYTEAFRYHGIDGDMLLEASDAVLDELGVTKAVHKAKLEIKFKKDPEHRVEETQCMFITATPW